MSKKILFWIILIVGICWVSGVGYWFIGSIENLDLGNIKWKENFTSEDIETQDFFRGILLIIVPFIILALALLFYSIGLFFGNKSKEIYYKVEEENENLKSELAQQINKVETMKIIYTGGKIEKKRGKEFLDKIEEKQVVERIQEKNKSEIKKDDLKVIEGIGERIEFF